MTDLDFENLTVEQLAFKIWQRGSPDGSPEKDYFRAERELRIERGTGCHLCTGSCRARDAIKAGMRCGTTRCGSGKGPVRTRAEVSGNHAQIS